jgi:hypothetical protein
MPAMPVNSTDLNRSQWMSVQKWTADEELEAKSRRPNILLGSRTTLEGTKNESESEEATSDQRAAERDALYLYMDLSLSASANAEPANETSTTTAVR